MKQPTQPVQIQDLKARAVLTSHPVHQRFKQVVAQSGRTMRDAADEALSAWCDKQTAPGK